MKNEPNTFREFLVKELDSRSKKNSGYSIRAFARDLGLNDSTLSKILQGKMVITKNRILQIGKRLRISDKKIKSFIAIQSEKQQDYKDKDIELETFNLISEWYFDAIIELSKVDNFKLEPKNISKSLGISFVKARSALNQLKTLKIITEDSDGKIICNQPESLTKFYDKSFTTGALKNYQSQLLHLSDKALMSQSRSQRNHTSHVIAVDSDMIDEINNKIRCFQHELASYIEKKSKNKDKIYALQFTNFELTKH